MSAPLEFLQFAKAGQIHRFMPYLAEQILFISCISVVKNLSADF
jgi:hypothetical protein